MHNVKDMRQNLVQSLIVMALIFFSISGMAQSKQHASWKISSVKLNDTEVAITFLATLDSGWHLYSQHVRVEQAALRFLFTDSEHYTRTEGIREESKGIFRFDPFYAQSLNRFEGTAAFSQRIKLNPQNAVVNGKIEFTIGSDAEQPIREVLHFSVAVSVKAPREKVASNE